jgi:O-antigen ligase
MAKIVFKPTNKPNAGTTTSYSSNGYNGRQKSLSVGVFFVTFICGLFILYLVAGVLNYPNLAEILLAIFGLLIPFLFFKLIRSTNNLLPLFFAALLTIATVYCVYTIFSSMRIPENIDHGPGNDPETLGPN